MSLIAKSDPQYPLIDHLRDVGETTKEILQQNGADEELQRAGEIAGLFHDVGKANPQWQKEAKKEQSHLPKHSKLSAILTTGILESPEIQLSDQHKFGVILAVLHHHTRWTNQNMTNTHAGNKQVSQTIQNLLSVSGTDPIISTFSAIYANSEPSEMCNICEWVRSNQTENSNVMRIGLQIYSALRQADWHESSKVGDTNSVSTIPESVNPDTFVEYGSMRPFQKEIDSISPSNGLIGLAGCGEGKTYSSVRWAKNQAESGDINRLIYAMPTQVTTNNLYTKLTALTENNDVSLYHSSAQVYKHSAESDDSQNTDEIPSEEIDVSRSELYQAPINVTTVDHLLDTFLSNFDKSGVALPNVLHSGIVFDEIQAYDEKTVGNILGCIQRCDELGIPYYVMSATIPKQIRNQIPNTNTVTSSGSLQDSTNPRNPYSVAVTKSELTADSVTDKLKETDSKVMVVKNTVREAQNLARELKTNDSYDVYYFSSEFPQAHRKEKENEIIDQFAVGQDSDKTRILVCTQICEISLDLSADKLLTDIAPVDSIFQRAGRVHRSGEYPNSSECSCDDCKQKQSGHVYETIVYDTTANSEAVYPYADQSDTKEFKLLQDTANELSSFGIYSFTKSLDATDKVYQEYNLEFSELSRFNLEASNASGYLKNRSSRHEIRSIENNKISVLPCVFYKDSNKHTPVNLLCNVYNLSSQKQATSSQIQSFIEQYSIPVPNYWLHSDRYQTKIQGVLSEEIQSPISELVYSYETGVAQPQIEE